jgi:hypothetical protein
MNEATHGDAAIALSGPLRFAGTPAVDEPRNTTISGAIGPGVASVIKGGSGTLTFGNIVLSIPSFDALLHTNPRGRGRPDLGLPSRTARPRAGVGHMKETRP